MCENADEEALIGIEPFFPPLFALSASFPLQKIAFKYSSSQGK